jgi:hypothetical protein
MVWVMSALVRTLRCRESLVYVSWKGTLEGDSAWESIACGVLHVRMQVLTHIVTLKVVVLIPARTCKLVTKV